MSSPENEKSDFQTPEKTAKDRLTGVDLFYLGSAGLTLALGGWMVHGIVEHERKNNFPEFDADAAAEVVDRFDYVPNRNGGLRYIYGGRYSPLIPTYDHGDASGGRVYALVVGQEAENGYGEEGTVGAVISVEPDVYDEFEKGEAVDLSDIEYERLFRVEGLLDAERD